MQFKKIFVIGILVSCCTNVAAYAEKKVDFVPYSKSNNMFVPPEGSFMMPENDEYKWFFLMDNSNYRNFDTIRRGLFYKEKGLLNKEDKLLLGGFYTKGLHSGYFLYSTPLNKKGLRTDLAYVGESTKGASGYFESTRYRDHNNAYCINFAQSVVQNSKSYAEIFMGATDYNCPVEYRSIPGSKTVSGYTDVNMGYLLMDFGNSHTSTQKLNMYYGHGKESTNIGSGRYLSLQADVSYKKSYKHGQYLQTNGSYTRGTSSHSAVDRSVAIAGPYSVRGYDFKFISCRNVLKGNFNYGVPLSKDSKYVGYVFYDVARLQKSEVYQDIKILASTGIGVDANLSRNYYLNLELVHPFQHNFEGKHPQSKAKANFTLVARF